jgi:6-pyruvoyltetrahydropterin/6-carboxytetrahydropterin synthase
MSDRFELAHNLRFEAAHYLPRAPEGHKCRRLHGHSFCARIVVAGPLDEKAGWVIDFSTLDTLLRPVCDQLDHRLLNDVEGLANPTSEEIARWLWRRIETLLPSGLELLETTVRETCSSAATFRGESLQH